MAKGRFLSKSISVSKKFNEALPGISGKLREFPGMLWMVMNAHADDFGRLSGDIFTVRTECLPASARSPVEFSEALRCLDAVGLIQWYEVSGCKYVQIVGFENHQTGLHKRTKSRFPEPPFRELPGTSGKFREIPSEEKRTEEKGTELNGREGKDVAVKLPHLDFVKLTAHEAEMLKKDLNGKADEYINRLNGYLGSTGKKYKSHYHTIMNWWRRDRDSDKTGGWDGISPPRN